MSEVYGLGASGEAVKQMQRAFGEILGLNITADGQLGKISCSAIESYQHKFNLPLEEDARGNPVYGPTTQAHLEPYIRRRFVQIADLADAAKDLGIELATIRAVTTVEAKEFGFFKNGFPVILFERHKFYKYLIEERGQAFATSICAQRGDICNPKAGGYLGKEAEIRRLEAAIAINETAALKSASYGLFQLMGFNYKLCGYATVQSFVQAMKDSEDNQLKAFVAFVKSQGGMWQALKTKAWERFAELYNGPKYRDNNYHIKLPAAWKLYA